MEIFDSYNAAYNIRIGSAVRRFGYEQVGQTIQYGNDSLWGGIFNYGSNSNRIFTGINNANNTNATLNFLDSGGNWTTVLSDAAPNTHFQCLNWLNYYFVAGYGNGQYYPLTTINSNMVVDRTSNASNVLNAPACKFIAQYAGQLYAINCQVNGINQPDCMYVSSVPTGYVTTIQAAVNGWACQLHVDLVQYLKVGMTIDIYGAQTTNLKVQALQITSVDKLNNMIGVSGQVINVNIHDEVWISGRFGQYTMLWNTDYPTPQTCLNIIRLPSSALDENVAFTGYIVNNNRLFLFTKNTFFKWDGTNLTQLAPSVGCVNHNTIQNIGSWTLWAHTTGVWGYNDTTGQLKMISRAITPTYQTINPVNFQYASAVISNRTYKLSVGQLMNPVLQTTSTSTSSTSTSSTSSSTSSTSTSSTSASTIITTTSTSSTSTSISSTSISSTSTSSTSSSISTSSTSSSTSSTSTSTTISTTTTQPTGLQVTRLCYDFDLNNWGKEYHNRNIRYQFMHNMNGFTKPYFTDDNGYLFRDETGLTDAGISIPMMVEFGRTNCGTEQQKIFDAVQIDSERTRTGLMQYSLDGGDWRTLGQIDMDITTMVFPQKKPELKTGHDINLRFVHNNAGDPPFFNGWTLYFDNYEAIVGELGVGR